MKNTSFEMCSLPIALRNYDGVLNKALSESKNESVATLWKNVILQDGFRDDQDLEDVVKRKTIFIDSRSRLTFVGGYIFQINMLLLFV